MFSLQRPVTNCCTWKQQLFIVIIMWNTHTYTLCEQHAEFFVLNLVVCIEINGLDRVNIHLVLYCTLAQYTQLSWSVEQHLLRYFS